MSDLIIYFSRADENYFSGTIKNIEKGNTEVLAEFIHDLTGAELFKVVPKKSYPINYHETTAMAKKEFEDNVRPEIEKTLDDVSSYDVIYIGFPNWWGTLPMPMWTQLEQLDFSEKTIKPFVTHEGSSFGNSLKDLERLCKGADIKKGLSIVGSNVYDSKDTVELWINE